MAQSEGSDCPHRRRNKLPHFGKESENIIFRIKTFQSVKEVLQLASGELSQRFNDMETEWVWGTKLISWFIHCPNNGC